MGWIGKRLDDAVGKWADGVIEKLPEAARPGADGSVASYDWCRFRKNAHCMFPTGLDHEASQVAGYAVWFPLDRGECPKRTWEQQEACEIAEPGPFSGRPDARIECTKAWDDGGQRGGVPGPMPIDRGVIAANPPPRSSSFDNQLRELDTRLTSGQIEKAAYKTLVLGLAKDHGLSEYHPDVLTRTASR